MTRSRGTSAVVTCSERIACRLLDCSLIEVLQMEQAGQLRHSQFWREYGLANAQAFFRQHWKSYDVRHYLIEDVVSLLPLASPTCADLRQLKRQFLKAGQIELTSWGMPYIGIAISGSGEPITAGSITRVPRRPQTLVR
ncbi:hypothetical protein ACVWXM_002549 [Bradyrhizobium sp. GM7.3]